jgi:hypothetical protein
VKRLLSPLLVLSLLVLSTDCGNVFIRGAIETGPTMQGTVSIVQVSNSLNGMESTQVTFVTLLQNGTSSTIGFCGDQSVFFPLDQSVRVNFSPGQLCATVILVIVVV